MNISQIPVFFIRLTGFSFLVDAIINLTYLPEALAAADNAKGAVADLREFLVFPKPLSKLFTRGPSSFVAEEAANENTWPPAPKSSNKP